MVSKIQAHYALAEQFRSARFSYNFNLAFMSHMLSNALPRIIELSAMIIKKFLPSIATYLGNLSPQSLKFHVISDEDKTWQKLATLTESLKKKAGLTQEINTYCFDNNAPSPASFDGGIILSESLLESSTCECEFLIMHEIKHIQLSHFTVRLALSTVFAVLDLIALYYSPSLILCIEVAAFYIENALSQSQELEADQEAVKALGTAQEAASFFRKKIDQIYPKPSIFLFPELQDEAEKIQEWACNFSQISHPSFTKRLQALKIP